MLTSFNDNDELRSELRALLTSCQELAARHRAALDQFRDSDGTVIEEKYADYDEARISTALEASDRLAAVIERLAALVGPPTPVAFTLTFAGRERHHGQAPTSFVVNAANLDDAARVLAGLPSWHEWYQADAACAEEGADVVYVPEQSHADLPPSGHFVDLRGEHSPRPSPASAPVPSGLRPAAPVTGPRPAAAPACPAARNPL